MCGIFGLLQRNVGCGVDETILEAACVQLSHRGPDGNGTWLSPDRQVGFAHTRLAIVDLDDAAGQPMVTADNLVAVTFNGEIYNHLALRAELVRHGHVFVTDHSDTEVLLHGYREWGIEGLLTRLDGMFAFAIWDGAGECIHLCRDRLGIKPLYYAETDGGVAFASDIPPLLDVPGVSGEVNWGALDMYLCFLVVPAPETLVAGVKKLPAGYRATYRPNQKRELEVVRYWDSPPGSRNVTAGNATGDPANLVRSRLEEAVRKRLMADVPVGIYLSGGTDSSTLAEFAAAHRTDPLHSFTIGYGDYPENNETADARATAGRLALEHHEVILDGNDVEGILDDLIEKQGEPISDWVCIPLYHLARSTAAQGVKVILVGEGADEAFAGYSGYLAHLRFEKKYGGWLRLLPGSILRVAGWLLSGLRDRYERADEFCDILTRLGRGHPSFLSGAVGFREGDLAALFGEGRARSKVKDDPGRACDHILSGRPSGPTGPASALLTYQEFKLRLSELLLMRVDKMTMAHGVEARVPFLDHKLIEGLSELPEEARIPAMRPKGLLRKALSDIFPPSFLDRPKIGFAAPVSQWLREAFGDRVEREIMGSAFVRDGMFQAAYIRKLFDDHRHQRKDHSVRIWALYNLCRWHHWLETRGT